MIAVSAHVFNEEVESYLSSGFDGFLPKPLEKEALSELIVEQLDGHTLLLPQPDPSDAVCYQLNSKPKETELDLSALAFVSSTQRANQGAEHNQGEPILQMINPKIIKDDLAILGREK